MYRRPNGRFANPKHTTFKENAITVLTLAVLTVMVGYGIGYTIPDLAVRAENETSQAVPSPTVTPTTAVPSPTVTVAPIEPSSEPVEHGDEYYSEADIIGRYPHADVIRQIYRGESNYGKYDKCRQYGKFNGMGWKEPNPIVNGPTCFDTFEQLVGEVNDWIDDKVQKGWSRSMMNCYYVRGLAVESCNTAYKLN